MGTISSQEILSILADHPWADRIQVFDQVESTNTLAKHLALQGAPAGTVLIADSQTGGRGRLGRSFLSPAGTGIYMSVILRPAAAASQLMHLTCAAAESMCDAVEQAIGIRPQIKWTNDLVYNGKKLGGILTELSFKPGTQQLDYVVIGVGINCCQKSDDFHESIRHLACSAEMICHNPVNRAMLCARMIEAFRILDETLISDRTHIMDRYRKDCITLGQQISVLRGEEIRHGVALDLNETGALLVAFDDGRTEYVNSGEVSVRGMYGYV